LQDRWNEINNMDESLLLASPGSAVTGTPPASGVTSGSTAITTG